MSTDAATTGAWIRFDPDRDAGPAPSPCIQVCRVSAVTGWCEGCQRRLDEIGAWGGLDEAGRRAVSRRIRARRISEGAAP
jgi:predicted Fe-S protein YdhL (DUF1289 family)